MTFTLPCSGASACNSLELLGTFVTDGTTGTLTADNLLGWDLAIGNSGASLNPVHLTESNSNFYMSTGATLTAAADGSGLTFGISKAGDEFSFSSGTVGWTVGGQVPIQLLDYFSGNTTYLAFGMVTLPGQFTATSFGAAAPVPEPETYALMLAGLAAVGVIASRRRHAAKALEHDTATV